MEWYTQENMVSVSKQGHMFDFYEYFCGKPGDYPASSDSCLSFSARSIFTSDNGIKYQSVEQYMCAEKARLYKHYGLMKKIVDSTDLEYIRELSFELNNLCKDRSLWREFREETLIGACFSKFDQNDEMRLHLLSKGDCIFVYADPFDCYWGTGRSVGDPLNQNPQFWRGKNIAGMALTSVRDVFL